MTVNFRGYLFNDAGTAVSGATVDLFDIGTTSRASGTTADSSESDGLWKFDTVADGHYDVRITSGSSVRWIRGADQIQLKEIDVRNNTGNTTAAGSFTNYTNNASNQAAIFRSDRGTGNAADGDEVYLSFNLRNSNNEEIEFARITAEAVDVTDGEEDGQILFGIAKTNGSIVDVFTINSTTGGVTDMTLDVSGDLVLDAGGGDVFFKDGGTTFGSATNNSGNLILKSGTTTALTFSGANVTAAGTIGSGAITSTGIVTGTGFTAGNAVLAEAELELLDGLTAGTAIASKVVTTDANIDTSGQRNLTITGELDAATLDLSSSADIAGDLVLSGGADGALQFTNAGENSIKIPDNQASALIIEEANNAYITFVTTDSSEAITVAKATTFSAGIADSGTIAAGTWQGTAIASGYIAADAITGAKIADDAIDSEHYTDGSIDTAHLAADAVTGAKIADDAIDSEHYTDGSIDTAHIADNQVTLAKMAGIARGKIIYGDASGDPAVLTAGGAGTVLYSDGTDVAYSKAIYATDITIGEDAQTKIDFETANEIHFDADNAEIAKITATGLTLSAGENLYLGDGSSVNITAPLLAGGDHTYSGITAQMLAGAAITAFNLVCIHTTTQEVVVADASAVATARAIGIAPAGISDTATGTVLLHGFIRDEDWDWTTGAVLFLSETAGALTETAPTTDGAFVQAVGIALEPDVVFINPSLDIIEHA